MTLNSNLPPECWDIRHIPPHPTEKQVFMGDLVLGLDTEELVGLEYYHWGGRKSMASDGLRLC